MCHMRRSTLDRPILYVYIFPFFIEVILINKLNLQFFSCMPILFIPTNIFIFLTSFYEVGFKR